MDKGRRGKDLRIGDPERERAMTLLGEHFTAGRLEVHEYDERCRLAAAARFASEVDALFEDLPAPHPEDPAVPAPARTPRPSADAQRIGGRVVLLVCAAAMVVLLVVIAKQFALPLLVPLLAVFWFSSRR